MSDRERDLSVGEVSDDDKTSPSEAEDLDLTDRSPPTRTSLEKDANRLKSKFKILKKALDEEKLAEVNQEIKDLENGTSEDLSRGLQEAESKRTENLALAHERKRIKTDSILKEYQSKIQSLKDESFGIEVEESNESNYRIVKKPNPKSRRRVSIPMIGGRDLEEDVKIIQSKPSEIDSDVEYSNRDLVHSE